MKGLMLHCGGNIATRDQVYQALAPSNTETYAAVSHRAYLERVERELANRDIAIASAQYALAKEGNRFFALLSVTIPGLMGGSFARVLGLRNSYDKSCPVGLCIGVAPVVCDNLAFFGDVVVMHRHTPKVYQKFPGMIERAIGSLPLAFGAQDKRMLAYQGRAIEQTEADHIIMQAHRAGVILPTDIARVDREWQGTVNEAGERVYRHADFAPRSAWSLFNNFTEVMKNESRTKPGQFNANLWDLHHQSKGLHGIFDPVCGVEIALETLQAEAGPVQTDL